MTRILEPLRFTRLLAFFVVLSTLAPPALADDLAIVSDTYPIAPAGGVHIYSAAGTPVNAGFHADTPDAPIPQDEHTIGEAFWEWTLTPGDAVASISPTDTSSTSMSAASATAFKRAYTLTAKVWWIESGPGGDTEVGTQTASLEIHVNFVAVDLVVQGLREESLGTPHETNPGAFVGLNADDDDDDGTVDAEQSGTVQGENNLVAAALGYGPEGLNSGTLTLTATAGGSRIKVWTSATKGTEIVLPKSWDLASDTVPETVYAEGKQASAELRDIELQWKYDRGNVNCEDLAKVTVFHITITASGAFIVPGSQRNRVEYTIGPSGLPEGSGALDVFKSGSATAVRGVGLDSEHCEPGNHHIDWDGMGGGGPLTQADSPYTYVLALQVNGGLAEWEQKERKIEEWLLGVIVGDSAPTEGALVTGVDEETITTERFKVTVKFHDESGDPVTISEYDIDPNQESPDGPEDNEWDAHVWLNDSEGPFIFYTTPSTPVNIKYEVVLESIGEMVRDGVLNRWDMDETTDEMETKGTWVFGVEPDGSEAPFREFSANYEEVEEEE